MAAKLKKRALAEYQSQVLWEEAQAQAVPLSEETLLLKNPLSSSSGSSLSKKPRVQGSPALRASRGISSRSLSHPSPTADHDVSSAAAPLFDPNAKPSQQSMLLADLFAKIRQRLIQKTELQTILVELCKFLARPPADANVRQQTYNLLLHIAKTFLSSERSDKDSLELASMVRTWMREACSSWIHALSNESSQDVSSSILALLSHWYRLGLKADPDQQTFLLDLIREKLKASDHLVQANALTFLGSSLTTVCATDRSLAFELVSLVAKYTLSTDPRVRTAAFESLLEMHQNGQKLDLGMYGDVCMALKDDHDCVRKAALHLIFVLAMTYPDESVKTTRAQQADSLKLIDDAFGKICNSVNDLCVHVRQHALKLIGDMTHVSQNFLEQTLDKKLMSNMRRKKSAHQREAALVFSGEWSSGTKWADDAPREEVDPDTINVMSFGACGAFVHGLEDEYMAVRSQAIKSLTKLSLKNPALANLALDYLVDMFNDEIETVRLEAIESLTLIADHITLQVHQLETVLSALDDFSLLVREKLHQMLQASTIATQDGLQNVMNKLLESLKRYPQDKRSIYMTAKMLGLRHAKLTLPLVTQMLEIHPFFDTPEPDIEDPAYVCTLILIFNAAHNCPTIGPLLDQYTRRHFHYLVDTFPHLMPPASSNGQQWKTATANNNDDDSSTVKFLHQTLDRVEKASQFSMDAKIKLLEQARVDLERLGCIEPGVSDAATFASLFMHCQCLLLKTLSTHFWTQPNKTLPTQQADIIQSHVTELFQMCAQLEHKFIQLTACQVRQIQVLKLVIMALDLVLIVKTSNKSALHAAEAFLNEVENSRKKLTTDDIEHSEFLCTLFARLSEVEERKPGVLVRILLPVLLSCHVESLSFNPQVCMAHAVLYEPAGNNEAPLKYTAGMVLAVPVDAELYNVTEDMMSMVRLAICTPDQKLQLVTPMASQFLRKGKTSLRLLTNALMSHQVWSEALHVEISLVLDIRGASTEMHGMKRHANVLRDKAHLTRIIPLCQPVRVLVLPKAVKRGI